jgi:hypothetical protein
MPSSDSQSSFVARHIVLRRRSIVKLDPRDDPGEKNDYDPTALDPRKWRFRQFGLKVVCGPA